MNGITWQEELTARLEQAKAERAKVEGQAQYWGKYTQALEQLIRLEREGRSISVPDSQGVYKYTIDAEELRKVSVRQALIRIAASNNGLLVTKDVTTILLQAEIFRDARHARTTIFSTLGQSKRSFVKERPGVYRLTEYGQQRLKLVS